MDSGQEYRARVLVNAPPMIENEIWRTIDPGERIECERFHICGQDAAWATRHGNLHVCGYHRFLADVERTVENLKEEAVA